MQTYQESRIVWSKSVGNTGKDDRRQQYHHRLFPAEPGHNELKTIAFLWNSTNTKTFIWKMKQSIEQSGLRCQIYVIPLQSTCVIYLSSPRGLCKSKCRTKSPFSSSIAEHYQRLCQSL